jgi:protocatechuate 3,4-dioxygenase beta subunit
VVDTSGHPIAGASVQIGQRGPFADPSQGNSTATVTTDADGRWSTTGFSGEARALSFQVTKPDFLPGWYQETENTQPRDGAVRRRDLRDGTAEFRLTRGRALEGTVYSDRGEPVPGASVRLAFESPGGGPIQSTETDARGGFRFVVLDNGGVRLGVDAAGFAPFETPFQVGPGMGHAQLRLRRGRDLRGRVVAGDRPVSGATVGVLSIKPPEALLQNMAAGTTFPFDFNFTALEAPGQTVSPRRLATTDPTGSFVLTDVPTESLVVGILAPGFAPQQQVVRTNDTGSIQVALVPDFSFTGRVLDAVSGEPIPQFTVWEAMAEFFDFPPDASEWLDPSEEFWIRQWPSSQDSARGRFELAHHAPARPTSRFLVMAEGYGAQSTGPIATQGSRDHAFLLHRSKGITGVVVAPNGSPIPGADVAFRHLGSLQALRGRLISSQRGPIASTRPDGSFTLPAFLPRAAVVAMHQELGFAEIDSASSDQPLRITLQPFGSIAGRIRPASLPISNLVVRVYSASPRLGAVDFAGSLQAIPNADGQFVLHGIPTGLWRCQISRQLKPSAPPGTQEQVLIQRTLEVRPGQTTDLRFGESGRTLVGRIQLPEQVRDLDWQSNLGGLTTVEMKLPLPRSVSPSERRNWLNQPEVRAAHLAQRHHGLTWLGEGRFRIENVEPGRYRLALQFFGPWNNPMLWRDPSNPVGSLDTEITVPAPGAGSGDEVIDLGTLNLQAPRKSPTRP